jgi:hypothetical protein
MATRMEASRLRCVVVLPDGPSRRVGPSGLVIGRQRDCDIVAIDPSVSRRHALIRLVADGVEVLPLGRGPISVNGKKTDRPTPLADGDRIGVPGLEVTVQVEAQRPDTATNASYRLDRARGGGFGIVHSPFVVGGGDTDDLIVKKWPAAALRLHLAQGDLYLEATAAKTQLNGRELEPGAMEPVVAGDEIEFRKEVFVVRQAAHDATTAATFLTDLPRRVVVEMLPRGGRVVFTVSDGERAVFLADRRLDLVIALLRPPDGYKPGEYVPDDVVRAIVWPRNPGVSRPEINMLISRCRRDLVEAGLAGARLLERAPGGGGTRLLLADGAEVVVSS